MSLSVTYKRTVQDSLAVGDTVLATHYIAWALALAESVTLGESIARLAPAARLIQEPIGLAEIIRRVMTSHIVITEALKLHDFFIALFPRQIPALITDLVHHPARWSIPAPAIGQDWDMVAGEDRSIVFLPEGDAHDITDWNIRWELRQTDGGAIVFHKDTAAVGGVTVTDGPNGLITLLLAAADTLALPVQSLPWFWELRRDDGGNSTTLARGTLTIEQAVVE